MEKNASINKIAFLGDYYPRKCGIATFTKDLRTAIARAYPEKQCIVVPVNDIEEGYDYPEEVRFEIAEPDLSSYLRAADFLNISDIDILCVEHEFGIYGGHAGSHLLALMHEVHMPIVTTLHTILQEPNADQHRVMNELIRLSTRLITMSEKGQSILMQTYQVPASKIDIISHGIPDIPFADSNYFKEEFGVIGKKVLLTFGLLSPNKGIEYVLHALPKIIEIFPEVVFIVVGQTHPNLIRNEGESYRMQLKKIAQDLGIQKHVVFFNRFVELDELMRFIGAADIYITPYLNEAQINSGTLAYAYGTGNAVVSTPYWHATELLTEGRGKLVPFRDSESISTAINELLSNDDIRYQMRKNAYDAGRDMVWSAVAKKYMECFHQAGIDYNLVGHKASPIRTLEEQLGALPDLRLDHLFRLSDATGILQHAHFTVPNFAFGYCTDDNARALLLTLMLTESGNESSNILALSSTYLAFLNYALDPETKRFRNFMSYDRKWITKVDSEDSHAHALWALGYCIGHCNQKGMRMLAADLFEQALPIVADFSSPRAWAITLLGVDEYLNKLEGDRYVNQISEILVQRLLNCYKKTAKPDWLWFENELTYVNARLSHALIRHGIIMKNNEVLEIGLASLQWLVDIQTSKKGVFRPVGNNGFYCYSGECAKFDQQPIEAQATVSACIAAYKATEKYFWITEAQRAFEWFLGRNDVGIIVYDSSTGGCHDGLHTNRINQNEGCESTLAFLLALTEMQSIQSSLTNDADWGVHSCCTKN